MSDSDDDMPPPLEDMSESINVKKALKQKAAGLGDFKTQDHEEEVRLAPKKPKVEEKEPAHVSKIAASDDYDFDAPKVQKEEKPAAPKQKKKQNSGFGGFSAGFLSAKPSKGKAQPKPKPVEAKPVLEDHTHLKASKEKNPSLRFQEVQDAMTSKLEANKGDWLTPEFFAKLQSNPKLLKAFTNPVYMGALKEMGEDPKKAMEKYGGNPEFREIMMEFSAFMGNHFEGVADKKKEEAEEQKRKQDEEMKADPVYQTIQQDPQVKACLEDPEVQKILEHLRFTGGLDLHEVMRENPAVGQKMMFLIQKGVLNTQSTLPGPAAQQ